MSAPVFNERLRKELTLALQSAVHLPPLIEIIAAYMEWVQLSVSTIAGMSVAGSNDGVGTDARFSYPMNAAVYFPNGKPATDDPMLLVTEFRTHIIRCVNLKTLAVTRFAGDVNVRAVRDGPVLTTAALSSPFGIAVDPTDNSVFITEHTGYCIRRIKDGVISRVAGGVLGGVRDGTGSAARFCELTGLAISSDGKTLLVCDENNHRICAVDLTNSAASVHVTTIGPPESIKFRKPVAVCYDNFLRAAGDDEPIDAVAYVASDQLIYKLSAHVTAAAATPKWKFTPVPLAYRPAKNFTPDHILCVARHTLLLATARAVYAVDTRTGAILPLAGSEDCAGLQNSPYARTATFKTITSLTLHPVADGSCVERVYLTDGAGNNVRVLEGSIVETARYGLDNYHRSLTAGLSS